MDDLKLVITSGLLLEVWNLPDCPFYPIHKIETITRTEKKEPKCWVSCHLVVYVGPFPVIIVPIPQYSLGLDEPKQVITWLI